jgi:hypothetical protein
MSDQFVRLIGDCIITPEKTACQIIKTPPIYHIRRSPSEMKRRVREPIVTVDLCGCLLCILCDLAMDTCKVSLCGRRVPRAGG